MGNALSKIAAAILAVVLIFLFPAFQSAQRQEDIRVLSAYNTLVQFTDAVRSKGYVSAEMYEDFARELETTGAAYDIELEHRHKKYHPEYKDPADPTTFMDEFSVVYDSNYTSDILKMLFPSALPAGGPVLRKYRLEAGDYLSVTLTKVSRSPLEVLSGFIYGTAPEGGQTKHLSYGGMVLNEDY
ncbi:hypothetical protein NYE70_05690 [Paenibacillus sp. FSL R5-0407]|uniref:hypothetical protein n=1 Tax=Paenibacillus sp. FSL R5-0407 TaxID=2975320 RepID=UPI0030F5B8EC